MNDLQLDTLTGDLLIENLEAYVVKGADRVRQQLYVKLNLWVGEWFLDTEFGTPYVDSILGKQISLNGAIAALKRSILSVTDVESISKMNFQFDRATRKLVIDFECKTPFGLIRGPRPVTPSPVQQALDQEGITIPEFLMVDDQLNTLINETIPSHGY